jgi:pyruvate/2-oxoglutarate dehydrogenase complex dihydrolipoamide acyltransferase (E2) component
MIRSDTIQLIATALAAAHAVFPPLVKNRTVTVQPREGRPYSFSYATLDGIMECVRVPLATNGLAVIHSLVLAGEGESDSVETLLVHTSGEFIGTRVPVTVDKPGNQALGSALTYARRYGVCTLLALAADEDDDGNAADGHTVTGRQERRSKSEAARPDTQPAPATPAPTPAPATQPAPARNAAASSPKARWSAAASRLVSAWGPDEATHQITAVQVKHGANKLAALDELEGMASRIKDHDPAAGQAGTDGSTDQAKG